MNVNVGQFLQINDLESLRGILSEDDFTLRIICILFNIKEEEVSNLNEEDIIDALSNDFSKIEYIEKVIIDDNYVYLQEDMFQLINAQYFMIKQYQLDIKDTSKLFILTLTELIKTDVGNKTDIVRKLDIKNALYLIRKFNEFDEYIIKNYSIIFEEDYDDEYRHKGYKIPKNYNIIGMLDRLSGGDITRDEMVLKQNIISTMNRMAYWAHRDKRINSINKIISNKNGK